MRGSPSVVLLVPMMAWSEAVCELAQHAIMRPDLLRLGPRAASAADADDAVIPLAQHRRRPRQRAAPDGLPLDLRIQGEDLGYMPPACGGGAVWRAEWPAKTVAPCGC